MLDAEHATHVGGVVKLGAWRPTHVRSMGVGVKGLAQYSREVGVLSVGCLDTLRGNARGERAKERVRMGESRARREKGKEEERMEQRAAGRQGA